MEPYLIAIIVIGSLIIIGVIIFVSVYFTLGSSVVITTTPVSNVTIVPTAIDGERMKVLLPLYIYPPWDSVLVNNHPQNLIAIMNPNSGPGDSYDSEYANAVANLQTAKSNVIGYIATNYSSNSNISNVLQQVSNYNAWYGVNGIFYDEMSTQESNVSFYQDLYDKTKVVLEKNVNGNANVDTYSNLANNFSNSFRSTGVIHNDVMYIGFVYSSYAVDVSNVSPNYAAGPYVGVIGGISRGTDYVSYYGNIYYNSRGYFYSINTSNSYNLTLLGNFYINTLHVQELIVLNKNQTIIYYSNDGTNLRSAYLSNFQNYSNIIPPNGINYINYFNDTLIVYTVDQTDVVSNSNLLIYSGAYNGNLVLENQYSNFFNNLNTSSSVIDKNGKYFYATGTNLFVSKLESNYTLTLTSFLNIESIVANVTNDSEYLFTSGNFIRLFKANLDVPYLLTNYNNAQEYSSLKYTFCYNQSTSSLYYLDTSLRNNVISNIFSTNNINPIIVGNPGTNTIESYASTSDILVVYEGSNFSEYSSNSWQSNFSKNKFSALVYNSNEVQMMSAVQSSNQTLGSIYITDDKLPNPWDTIPNYYALESNLINNNIVF